MFILQDIEISKDGGTWSKLDLATSQLPVDKVFVGPIAEYNNYFDIRLKVRWTNSSIYTYTASNSLTVRVENT